MRLRRRQFRRFVEQQFFIQQRWRRYAIQLG
jgi:hypothetical protein